MRRLSSGPAALAGAMLACGVALAQKPAPLGAPEGPAAGGRPAAPLPADPPRAGGPGAGTDKFGLPVQPPVATAPQADKFAAPQPAPPPPAVSPSAPPSAAQAAPQPAPAPPPAAAGPADEHETVRRLRALLGAETRLAYAGADVIDPARGAVRLREVVLQRDGRRAAIAELSLDGLRDDGITEAILRGVLVQEATPGERMTVERVRIAGLGVAIPPAGQALAPDMLTLDSLRIEGLSVAGETPMAIATLTVEEYGRGRPGRLALEGVEVREPSQGGVTGGLVDRVSLGRLALRGVDLAAFLAAAVAKEPPPRTTGSAALEAEDLVIGQGDRRVAALGTMSLSGDSPPAGAAGVETGRLALRGISVQPFPGLQEWMQRFGYRELVGDLTADVRLDRAARRMEIGSLSLAARDIGALGFSMVLDGITPEETSPEALQRARLVSMRLRYVDQSLYGRYVRMQAQQTRRTEAQVREEMAAQARALFERPPGGGGAPGTKGGSATGGAATVEIGNAVQRFLRGQAREIEISARPPRPLPFEQLQGVAPGGPDALQQALGLTVTTR